MRHRGGFRRKPGMKQGVISLTPIPTRIVSNEEFTPPPQTPAQAQVEALVTSLADVASHRLGVTRRDFLRTTGGMAAALLAMNAVFGKFFDVLDIEAVEAAAFAERQGDPYFIFDVQTHYVGAHYDPTDAETKRKLAGDQGTIDDLSWENFVKEVFLDSETSVGLISTPPGPYPQEAVVPPKEMAHIRDEVNRVAGSQRMLAHGLATPQLGQADLDFMELQAGALKVDAWKCY